MTAAQAAIREIAGAMEDRAGNLPPLPAIFPDRAAPVVANVEGARVLTSMRWGLPSPAFALRGKKTDRGVTNVRNAASPHWRRWLGRAHRCVVPFTSFSEPDNAPGRPSEPVWFALSEDRPLSVFAGLWTRWTSVRKLKAGETTDDLFAFLTTEANAEVGAIHPKAMPVILRTRGEIDACAPSKATSAATGAHLPYALVRAHADRRRRGRGAGRGVGRGQGAVAGGSRRGRRSSP